MATVVSRPEERFIIESESWETYESMLAENENHRATRITYDRGKLEIMVVSVN